MSEQYINEPATKGKVCLHTSLGDIDIELWSKEAPVACRNFVQLCMEGYYDKCIFHTVIKDFITQTGDPTGTGEGGESIYGENFKLEPHQRLRFSRRGMVAMSANPEGLSASQFFFSLGPVPDLNGKHTIFGKIANKTIFNLLAINEVDLDADNRPKRTEKIKYAEILSNPFKDIVPRDLKELKSKEKKHKKDKKSAPEVKKNIGLLSFGDEEDEEELNLFNKKLKGKSAHDVLQDDRLSKDLAVKPEELGTHKSTPKEKDENDDSVSKVKKRLESRKRKAREEEKDDDVEIEDYLEDAEKTRKQEELAKVKAEAEQLQRQLAREMKGPKAVAAFDEDAKASDNMKQYKKLNLQHRDKTKHVVKAGDSQREHQTEKLLARFRGFMDKASTSKADILNNKKVDRSGEKTTQELLKEGAVPIPKKLPKDMMPEEEEYEEEYEKDIVMDEIKPEDLPDSITGVKIDEDAQDEVDADWMKHTFVAPEDRSGVTKAKDANLREESEDWYDINDPRNKMNQRIRD